MASFYQELLNKSEQQHNATVQATAEAQQRGLSGPHGVGPNMTILKPAEVGKASDVELARAARETGKEVELNDDNQIVDKRDLLSAGLNLSAPNTRNLAGLRNTRKRARQDEAVQVHTAVGSAASRREINERRAREVEKQILEEEERVARERELEAKEQQERMVKKRNNEETIQSARERYLERKRRKLEEEQAQVAEGRERVTT